MTIDEIVSTALQLTGLDRNDIDSRINRAADVPTHLCFNRSSKLSTCACAAVSGMVPVFRYPVLISKAGQEK